jgi:hypothetical protein
MQTLIVSRVIQGCYRHFSPLPTPDADPETDKSIRRDEPSARLYEGAFLAMFYQHVSAISASVSRHNVG